MYDALPVPPRRAPHQCTIDVFGSHAGSQHLEPAVGSPFLVVGGEDELRARMHGQNDSQERRAVNDESEQGLHGYTDFLPAANVMAGSSIPRAATKSAT